MSHLSTSPLSLLPGERRRRQEAVDYARASVGLEGLSPSPDAEALARDYVEGNITIQECVDTTLSWYA
jgi:hypothetical protein